MKSKIGLPPPAYFKSLTIENVKCFKEKQTLHFSDGREKPSQWTVILGNNGTGKTCILQCLAGLEPIIFENFLSKGNLQLSSQQRGKVIPNISAGGLNLSNLSSNYTIESSIFYGAELKDNTAKFLTVRSFGIKASKIHIKDHFQKIGNLKTYFYPVNRSIKKVTLTKEDLDKGISSMETMDAEEWLMQLDYARANGALNAEATFNKVVSILIKVLPEIQTLTPRTVETDGYTNYVEAETPYGKVPLKELSYGYLVMIAWVVDLIKKMVERYPDSKDPLSEPAVVLVDEIDLHLHPEWQRCIIGFLSEHFQNTQFIVTAHNPLIVQSIERVNIIVLQRDNDKTRVINRISESFKGWSVEEVLNDLMGLQKTKSDKYVSLLQEFESSLNQENSAKAKEVFKELTTILHPQNELRKLLSIQLASINELEK